MQSTRAILLRRIKLTDTSLIVTWLTEDFGVVRTAVKGARRPKSVFAGKLDLFFLGEIQFQRSRKSDLHHLREMVLQETHAGIRDGYGRLRLASYFVELIELVTAPDHAAPELFDLLLRALNHVSNHPEPGLKAFLHFEDELVRLLGLGTKAETPIPASRLLGQVYGRLPAERADLLASLQ